MRLGRFCMTKDDVIRRIRELAAEWRGHVGLRAFFTETGIKENWLRRQEWYCGWSNLVAEAGLESREFSVGRTPRSHIAEAVALLVEELGHWPTEDELTRARGRDKAFPSMKVIRPLRKSGELAALIVALGTQSERFAKAAVVAQAFATAPAEASTTGPNERIVGYVYLLRSGSRYKVGKSNDPSRRYREVRIELPDETHQVHTIPTDDPTGIEKYWHERFASKRVRNTEFFLLSAEDVQAFKRRKYQ